MKKYYSKEDKQVANKVAAAKYYNKKKRLKEESGGLVVGSSLDNISTASGDINNDFELMSWSYVDKPDSLYKIKVTEGNKELLKQIENLKRENESLKKALSHAIMDKYAPVIEKLSKT